MRTRYGFTFWIFILFVLLQIGDGVSTYILNSEGILMEDNPIARYLFLSIGTVRGILISKSLAIIGGLACYLIAEHYVRRARLIKFIFVIVILEYAYVNLNNWRVVYYALYS